MSKQESMYFSISGEYLTNHFRDMVFSGKFNKAFKQLKEIDSSQPDENILGILSGTLALTGVDSDIHLVEEDAAVQEAYLSELDSIYSGYLFDEKLYSLEGVIGTSGYGDDCYHRARFIYASENDKIVEHNGLQYIFKPGKDNIPVFLYTRISEREVPWDSAEEIGFFGDFDDFREFKRALQDSAPEDVLEAEFEAIDEMLTEAMFKALVEDIHSQANETGGFFQWVFNGKTYSIPETPFMLWAFRRDDMRTNYPFKWEVVCDQGMKMQGDDPIHSDWMIGAKMDLDNLYHDNEFSAESTRLAFKKVKEFYAKHDSTHEKLKGSVVNGSGMICGTLKFFKEGNTYSPDDIVIIPNSNVGYFELAKFVSGVIAEIGGPLSHLALNAKENNIKFMLLPDAKELLNDCYISTVCFDSGLISQTTTKGKCDE